MDKEGIPPYTSPWAKRRMGMIRGVEVPKPTRGFGEHVDRRKFLFGGLIAGSSGLFNFGPLSWRDRTILTGGNEEASYTVRHVPIPRTFMQPLAVVESALHDRGHTLPPLICNLFSGEIDGGKKRATMHYLSGSKRSRDGSSILLVGTRGADDLRLEGIVSSQDADSETYELFTLVGDSFILVGGMRIGPEGRVDTWLEERFESSANEFASWCDMLQRAREIEPSSVECHTQCEAAYGQADRICLIGGLSVCGFVCLKFPPLCTYCGAITFFACFLGLTMRTTCAIICRGPEPVELGRV